MLKAHKVLFAIILLVAAATRLYNFWGFSLSNDELSALARLNFNSFSDLIYQGVRIDGHPPAAQVLLFYFTKWFGDSVFIVRLPFVLVGIGSVFYMYRLGKEWISSSAGLLSAALFAVLIFPMLYSRIARPYALGMFFTLMASVYWIRILKENHRLKDFLFLAFSLALCAYSHYFAALVAAILAFTGTFLIKGPTLKKYLVALGFAFLFYLPYIPTFLHQLSLGGIGQWLGAPENDWLWQHVDYVFNESLLILIPVVIIAIIGYAIYNPPKTIERTLLPLCLFLAPFLVGFTYSTYVNPVLQHSTLLFSFPFLLIFLFSGWDDGKTTITTVTTGLLLSVGLYSTVSEKDFYHTNHFGVFKEVAWNITQWNNEAENNAILIGDFNHPSYIHYYLDRFGNTQLDQYRTTNANGLKDLKKLIAERSDSTLIYSWSTVNQSPEVELVIRETFPVLVRKNEYFNSAAFEFTRGKQMDFHVREVFNFEKNEVWNLNPEAISVDSVGTKSIEISANSPYGPTFMVNLDELETKGIQTISVKIGGIINEEQSKLQLVYEQVNEEGGYAWESDLLNTQFEPGQPDWGVFQYAVKPKVGEMSTLKVYLWLPDGEPAIVTGMEVRLH